MDTRHWPISIDTRWKFSRCMPLPSLARFGNSRWPPDQGWGTPKRLSPCKSSVFTQNSMAHRRKVGPCKSPCNWFSPMAHRDHRIKNIMILFCFGGQSQWHTALEVFNPWFCLALIKNIVLCPRSPWHKRFQTPYMTEIHHSFVITFLAPKQTGTPWFTIDEKCVV